MSEVLNELQNIFRDVFDDKNIIITNETSAKNIDDWDSLSQIRLVMSIEKFFGVKFSHDELQNMNNVGDMAGMISKKLCEKS